VPVLVDHEHVVAGRRFAVLLTLVVEDHRARRVVD